MLKCPLKNNCKNLSILELNRTQTSLNNVCLANKFENFFSKILSLSRLHKNKLMIMCIMLGFYFIFCLGNEVLAASLENQLDSVNTIVNTKIKTYGIMGASIAGGIWAIFQGNIKQAAIIVTIAVILSYYLGWVEGGMVLTAGAPSS